MAAAMLAEQISAERRRAMGIDLEVRGRRQVIRRSAGAGTVLATQATKALGLMKRAIYASPANTFDRQLDLERDSA